MLECDVRYQASVDSPKWQWVVIGLMVRSPVCRAAPRPPSIVAWGRGGIKVVRVGWRVVSYLSLAQVIPCLLSALAG